MSLKIGDTLYRFDGNRRVFAKQGIGSGPPIYREHFEALKIEGENRTSWILQYGWKVNKKTLKGEARSYQYAGRGFFTAGGMEDDIWLHDHKHKIVQLVERASPPLLRAIAEIVGYHDKPGGP